MAGDEETMTPSGKKVVLPWIVAMIQHWRSSVHLERVIMYQLPKGGHNGQGVLCLYILQASGRIGNRNQDATNEDGHGPLAVGNEQTTQSALDFTVPSSYDLHGKKVGSKLHVCKDHDCDKEAILETGERESLVLFTDGSYQRRDNKDKAGWGIIVVKDGGGLKGEEENNGTVRKKLLGPVVSAPKYRTEDLQQHRRIVCNWSSHTLYLGAI